MLVTRWILRKFLSLIIKPLRAKAPEIQPEACKLELQRLILHTLNLVFEMTSNKTIATKNRIIL